MNYLPIMPEKFNVRFVGLKETNVEEKELKRLVEIADREAKKIYREIKNNFNLLIAVKEYKTTGGAKRKYSINIKLQAPGQSISGKSHRETWKAKDALHKAFENVKNKINTAYRADSNYRKSYE